MLHRLIHLIAGVMLAFASAQLASAMPSMPHNAVALSDNDAGQLVGKYLRHQSFDDAISVDELLSQHNDGWQAHDDDVVNFGFHTKQYWFSMELDNNTGAEAEYWLEFAFPLIDKLNVYELDDNNRVVKTHKLGDFVPVSERFLFHRFFIVPFQFTKNETKSVIISVETSEAVNIPMRLWTPHNFVESDQLRLLLMGTYSGIMLIMLFYNLFIYFSLRDRSYLYYSAYVGVFTLAQLGQTGISYQYFWPNSPEWNHLSMPILISLSILLVNQFSIRLLNLRGQRTRFLAMFQFFTYVSIANMILTFFLPYIITVRIAGASAAGLALVAFIAGVKFWIRGNHYARYFVLAYLTLMVGVITLFISRIGLIPYYLWMDNAFQIGAVLEVALLSFALASRLSEERRAKLKAKAQRFSAMKKQKRAEYQLLYRSTHDSRTDFPNKVQFEQIVNQEVIQSNRPFSVIILKLHRFNEINNTLGHRNGDAVLLQVAKRLREFGRNEKYALLNLSNTKKRSIVAQIGSDRFTLIFLGEDRNQHQAWAEDLLERIGTTYSYKNMALNVSPAAGICHYPTDATEVDTLLQKATIAADFAGEDHQAVRFYTPDIDPYSARRLALMGELRDALEAKQLVMYYQPITNLHTGAIEAVEALVRWQHPSEGFILPSEFITIAEHTGLIKDLTRWVINQSINDLKKLQASGLELEMCVNVSTKNLRENDFQHFLIDRLTTVMGQVKGFTVEVTESRMMEDGAQSLATVISLNHAGIKVAIDDFGTGYSSLAYLKKLPAQKLKIDREFVKDMTGDEDDSMIVQTILSISKTLGLKVVAEGIEDEESYQRLQAMGCDQGQGYFIARPMPIGQLLRWASHHNNPPQTLVSGS